MTEEALKPADPDLNAGWVHLLPVPAPGCSIVCIELYGLVNAQVLAYWHPQVIAAEPLDTDWSRWRCTRYVDGVRTGTEDRSAPTQASLPFESASQAGMVLRLLADAKGNCDGARRRRLLSEAARVVRSEGFLYVDFINPWSLQRAADAVRQRRIPPLLPTRSRWRRNLVAAGWNRQRCASFLLERGRVFELIPEQGYRPSRNAWNLSERMKRRMLGRYGMRVAASAFGIVAGRQAVPISADRALAAGVAGTLGVHLAPRWERFLVNPGKSFIEFAAGANSPGRIMCVLPWGGENVSRRRTELEMLRRLRERALDVVARAPRLSQESSFAGRPIFLFEGIPGVTVDAPTADMERLMQAAVELLIDFNRATCRADVDSKVLCGLVERASRAASIRYPGLRDEFKRTAEELVEELAGFNMPQVWMHGDYKLENLVFCASDRSVAALIDWELSSDLGIAGMDLLYLLLYRRITEGKAADVLELTNSMDLKAMLSPSEQATLQTYSTAIGVPNGAWHGVLMLLFLHHVGCRFRYDAADATVLGAMRQSLVNWSARRTVTAGAER